ncbi:MAG: response regulator [Gemmatimonadales bacterium]
MATIIVIEDDDAVRSVMRRALERHGHLVVEAPEGARGVELLREHDADLVITDIFMPGQDGILTLRQIRKEFPTLKVIVVSGGDRTGRLDLRKDAELLGAVRSVRKPFTATEIVTVVTEILGHTD